MYKDTKKKRRLLLKIKRMSAVIILGTVIILSFISHYYWQLSFDTNSVEFAVILIIFMIVIARIPNLNKKQY
jgi:O-antigen/teichoic acid export membrane protein